MFTIEYMGCHYTEVPSLSIDRPNGSHNYLLLLFQSDIYIMVDGVIQSYKSGTAILYSPFHPQFYHNPVTGFDNDWVHFIGEDIAPFLDDISFPLNTPFFITDVNGIHKRLRRIEEEYLRKDKNHLLMIDTLLKELILSLTKEHLDPEVPKEYSDMDSLFRTVRSTILSRLEYPWTIDSMSALTNLSTSRFSHIYQEIFHISPKKDLLTERMNMARFLIQSHGYTVSEVAAKVGYDNLYHFSKQFKIITGKSPSAYRS